MKQFVCHIVICNKKLYYYHNILCLIISRNFHSDDGVLCWNTSYLTKLYELIIIILSICNNFWFVNDFCLNVTLCINITSKLIMIIQENNTNVFSIVGRKMLSKFVKKMFYVFTFKKFVKNLLFGAT